MGNTTILSAMFKLCIIILIIFTLFMSLQARSLKGHVDSLHLLHEFGFDQIKHTHTRISFDDRVAPGGPDPIHNNHHHLP
ncbi:hypothetical protein Lalb_Chr14g0367351 [Lupinus albus]|uniref:CLAVATA3/ESR (CLE)-related protein n=1 Tax=Lupinus albus TaxID=3870 RepID=A0A6A4PET2_LUPAL|nr:hypothetical protein Lalb_Chr14g0367351 [Lupinus albus]